MSDFAPTPEQELILAEAKSPQSMLVNALAGAAKTSTLCLLAKKLPLQPTLCCAFNKKIADEMQKRMPGHIQCSTMNSLGHRAWAKRTGTRLIVESDKVYQEVLDYSQKIGGDEKKRYNDSFSSIMRVTRAAKSYGYVPASVLSLVRHGAPIIDWDELMNIVAPELDVEISDEFEFWVNRTLEAGISDAFKSKIDYDDQIYMSVLFGGQFSKFPIIMVDEAQDLSSLNHEMIRLMFGGRLIAVGDPNQSIYLFRGAKQGSMDLLREEFSMKEFTLSVSFRCPKSVVERARWRAPHMQYPDWAKAGVVSHVSEWGADTFHDGDAIICRNNAPLFQVALRLIRKGRGVKLLGNDVGPALVRQLKKFGEATMPQESVFSQIKEWEDAEVRKANDARVGVIRDRAACLRVFADFGQTLGEAVAYAEHLFSSQGSILMMSGHKSKGLEFDTVYHLDPHLIPSKRARMLAEEGDDSQLEQERNLRYVIETRSMNALYFIESESFA